MADPVHGVARTDRSWLANWWWTIDRPIAFSAFGLIAIGVLLSLSSSPAAAYRIGLSEPFYFFSRQIVFAGLGLVVMFVVSNLNPRGVRRLAALMYLGSLLLMVAILFMGHEAKGAARWISVAGFTLQPSEFMKPALIILAAWMFAESNTVDRFPGIPVAFGLYGVAVVLLLLQPDFGQTVLITASFGATFFLAGVPILWIAVLGVLAMAGAWGAYLIFPHVADRVEMFINPENADTYQIDRAFHAIAEGGFWGTGPGEGRVKHLLPDAHTDFIYAVAAEEFGVLMGILLIALFALITARGLWRSLRLGRHFEQLAASGLFILFAFQAFINLAVNLRLVPPKGMTLPFISYGGSSMLAMAFTLGFALALTRRRPGAFEVKTPFEVKAAQKGTP